MGLYISDLYLVCFMSEILGIDYEDVLVRRRVLLCSGQVHWIRENKINLSSLLRILLQKEIRRRSEEVNP